MKKTASLLLSIIISSACCAANDRNTDSVQLKEIVVIARESRAGATASLIDRDAMRHLQPSSIADILELLPGSMSVDPDMGRANTIVLRQTGAIDALGNKTTLSDDYAISSLGRRQAHHAQQGCRHAFHRYRQHRARGNRARYSIG